MSLIVGAVCSCYSFGMKIIQTADAAKILNEIRLKLKKELIDQVNGTAQLVFLCSSISSTLSSNEAFKTSFILSNSVRDLTNKVSKHGTLNPKTLGIEESIDVAADLVCLIAHVPQIALDKLTPSLKPNVEKLSSILNVVLIGFMVKNAAKWLYKNYVTVEMPLALVKVP